MEATPAMVGLICNVRRFGECYLNGGKRISPLQVSGFQHLSNFEYGGSTLHIRGIRKPGDVSVVGSRPLENM